MSNENYNHSEIEKKWQERWANFDLYKAEDFLEKPKKYILIEFPYPSGAGLHVGHVRSYTALDIVARKARMQGYNVLYPIGWDAFGLPTENYAIKNKIHPRQATEENVAIFKRQLKSLGLSFDWSREINTTDPNYYKWTQWIFLQFFKHGLAYKKKMPINWCASCKIGLANEEVVDGKCERCGNITEKKEKEQWLLAITKYADRLIDDLETVDYLEKIKTQQINWIGRSEGAELEFRIMNQELRIKIYTTRLDTVFGATYVVVAPEHEIIKQLEPNIDNIKEVSNYIEVSRKKSEFERTKLQKEKTGVELQGIKAINPFTNQEIPVFMADYVLGHYGTGAVMAVPAHDDRDFEFAKKYNLSVIQVIKKENIIPRSYLMGGEKITNQELMSLGIKILKTIEGGDRALEIPKEKLSQYIDIVKEKMTVGFWNEIVGDDIIFIFKYKDGKIREIELNKKTTGEIEKLGAEFSDEPYLGQTSTWKWLAENNTYTDLIIHKEDGVLINSDEYNGSTSAEARNKLIEWLEKNQLGGRKINYKLRDWIFSRQHYWGEPIPIIICDKCGLVPVLEDQLPVELPDVKNYEPTDTGESPLSTMTDWVAVKCHKCGGDAKRETDTMPNWAGSSWYFLRYIDPRNNEKFADADKLKYWLPIDIYNGGMEHTTLHLLYSRFWHKFLYDLKLVPTAEPYAMRRSHGMVLAEDGKKMSKSLGNVINPDEIVEQFGVDSLRLYEMFMGPFGEAIPWSTDGARGVKRFLEKIVKIELRIKNQELSNKKIESLFHKTIKKITEDIDSMKFNTAVSAMMIFVNELEKENEVPLILYSKFLILLAPFAPHLAEELWSELGHSESIFKEKWPTHDENLIKDEVIDLIVQINGKLRDTVKIATGASEEEVKKITLESEKIKQWLVGKEIKKIIFAQDKLINIVI